MSKLLIMADNHLCTTSSVINGRGKEFSDRLENQIESFKWVDSFGLPVIHLGDFFDKSFLTAEEVSAFENIKPYIKKDWLFLRGNHEYSGEYDVLGILNSPYIRKPTVKEFGSLKALFLPFNATEEDIDGHYDIIFGHIGIKDIPFGAKGFDFNLIDKSCDIFLNGHLHNRYKFSETKWNIGSLTAQNFSDECTEFSKGVVIMDTDTRELEFVPNPYAFNFYKLDWKDWGKLSCETRNRILSKNSCISIKCQEGEKAEIVKSELFKDVYYVRISEESKASVVKEGVTVTSSMDYLGKFRKSFIEKNGESGVVLEELAEVLK